VEFTTLSQGLKPWIVVLLLCQMKLLVIGQGIIVLLYLPCIYPILKVHLDLVLAIDLLPWDLLELEQLS
jgi:hypothetical protein